MALVRVSDLTAATLPLAGTEALELDLGAGVARKCTTKDVADIARSSAVTALATSGSVTLDCALGDLFTLALTGNVTSLSFSNLPGSGRGTTKLIRITQDTTPRTISWPASFRWAGGTDGVLSTPAGSVDVLAITTFDNGSTWIATLGNAFAS